MSGPDSSGGILGVAGSLGRAVRGFLRPVRGFLEHTSGVWRLFVLTLYYSFIGPFRGKCKLRKQLFPMLSNVGVRSFPIVCLISVLIGSILVIQTGDILKQYGQLSQLPKLIALSMTREFAPVMTAIIMTARVGASFTAVIASMRINEEVMALETMAIHPVGFLVAPRFLSMVIMMPCLVVMSYLVGISGGALTAGLIYDIPFASFASDAMLGISFTDLSVGLMKATVFSVLITLVCCYYGLITEGGPMGLGRNTMVAVVTSLVIVIIADTLLGAFALAYFLT